MLLNQGIIRLQRRRSRPDLSITRVLLLVFLVFGCMTRSFADAAKKGNGDPEDYLDEDSVVLITGAAGFIGSELALALFRTYSPKRILCVDRMGDHPSTQEELALFEIQRQRAFHVMQTLGAKGRFYRVDFRPMIPEYFDLGEVPVLDHIFRENPDITHVVHLADPFPHAALQAVPREKDVPKAGMIEALLEQLLKVKRDGSRAPHFSYASSYEVYPSSSNRTLRYLSETEPITTPSSIRGASKLIDEILAKLYYDEHNLYSVGLRLFSIFGPWSLPGSPLFELAERAVIGQLPSWNPHWKSVQDYVYIDDAVDAIMAAMQYRPSGDKPHPLVVNVASGQGASLEDVANMMAEYFPPKDSDDNHDEAEEAPRTMAFGSTKRAEHLLGYQAQVSLKDGIVKLLAWHYDRAYPYGGVQQSKDDEKITFIANQGIVNCLPNDTECLNAVPVFPCSSECSHEAQCTGSFYDGIVGWTQALTAKCRTVLYTLDLDESLESIPSAHVRIKTTSDSFLDGNCNIAFVSDSSPLVRSLRNSSPMSAFMGGDRQKLLTTGKWILIPVSLPSFPTGDEHVLGLLPKLSPGLFFGESTTRAIYVDPDILLDSIPKLLREASMQPHDEEVEGATALLIGKGKPKDYFAQEDDDFVPKKQKMESIKSVVQNAAYRMVRIAVSDKLFGDGFTALLDSRWMVHTLQSDDSRLFRCDVLGEVVQWEVDTDRSALEFVLGLHDMWSRVITEKPWWIGESVMTVPEGHGIRRRLEQVEDENTEVGEEKGIQDDGSEAEEEEEEEIEDQGGDENQSGDEEEEEEEREDTVAMEEDDGQNEDDEIHDDSEPDDSEVEDDGRGGFGMKDEDVEEVAAGDKIRGASSEQDDDQVEPNADAEPKEDLLPEERDFSAYDTWMGVLSASSVKYFVRIVPSTEVGVVSLGDYDKPAIA